MYIVYLVHLEVCSYLYSSWFWNNSIAKNTETTQTIYMLLSNDNIKVVLSTSPVWFLRGLSHRKRTGMLVGNFENKTVTGTKSLLCRRGLKIFSPLKGTSSKKKKKTDTFIIVNLLQKGDCFKDLLLTKLIIR